jgi:hypothetical protein
MVFFLCSPPDSLPQTPPLVEASPFVPLSLFAGARMESFAVPADQVPHAGSHAVPRGSGLIAGHGRRG